MATIIGNSNNSNNFLSIPHTSEWVAPATLRQQYWENYGSTTELLDSEGNGSAISSDKGGGDRMESSVTKASGKCSHLRLMLKIIPFPHSITSSESMGSFPEHGEFDSKVIIYSMHYIYICLGQFFINSAFRWVAKLLGEFSWVVMDANVSERVCLSRDKLQTNCAWHDLKLNHSN